MEIQVLFFGVLAEIADTRFRHYSNISSFDDLNQRIMDDYPEMFHYSYRISLNNELIQDNPQLHDGDEVAFLPPFSGG